LRANTVHGGDHFSPADAAKLRAELAAKTLALAEGAKRDCDRLVWLSESHAYKADAAVKARIDALTEKYIAYLATLKGEVTPAVRTELSNMFGFARMCVRCGILTEDSALYRAIVRALESTKVTERLY
jgi:hypothetical protein